MELRDEVRATFPELADIERDNLRTGVVDAWALALEENGEPDLAAVPWLGPYQAVLGLTDESLADHIRDVTAAAVGIADAFLDRPGPAVDIDRDVVVAGALVHDVSQLAECDGAEWTATGRLLGHPHYGVYVTRTAGLPETIQHIVLSHTTVTDVDPGTIEAAIVERADGATANMLRSRALDDLREAPSPEPFE